MCLRGGVDKLKGLHVYPVNGASENTLESTFCVTFQPLKCSHKGLVLALYVSVCSRLTVTDYLVIKRSPTVLSAKFSWPIPVSACAHVRTKTLFLTAILSISQKKATSIQVVCGCVVCASFRSGSRQYLGCFVKRLHLCTF